MPRTTMNRDRDEDGPCHVIASRANFAASHIAILKYSCLIGGGMCSREATSTASLQNFACNG
eukprot:9468888-Pyramimonas_sp.AAC.1